MKRYFAICLAVLTAASCLLGGCKVKIMEEPTVSDAEFVYEYDGDILYTNEQLAEIDEFMGTKRQFFEKYPTPYVTEYENEESRFLYYSEDTVLAIYFDSKDERDMVYNDTFAISVPKEQLDQVKVGDSMDDVMELDPNGFYPFSGDYPTGHHHSGHYTSDKYIVWIYYSSDYIVQSIESESLID